MTNRATLQKALPSSKVRSFCKKYRHFLWALLVPVFITFYLINNELGNPEIYYASYTWLDDCIPFVPQFILAYFAWFPLLGSVGVIHLFTNSACYKRYIWALMIGLFAIQIFYIIFPNGQDLRLSENELPDNVFGSMVSALWEFDNNRDVIPSMHVFACIIIEISIIDSPFLRRKRFLIPFSAVDILAAASTVLIKQHSILDIFASFVPAAIVYIIVYVLIKHKQKPNTLIRGESNA